MAMTLKISCSMCSDKPDIELYIEQRKDLSVKRLKERIEKKGWIVQLNGDSIDTYCSKKCAT